VSWPLWLTISVRRRPHARKSHIFRPPIWRANCGKRSNPCASR